MMQKIIDADNAILEAKKELERCESIREAIPNDILNYYSEDIYMIAHSLKKKFNEFINENKDYNNEYKQYDDFSSKPYVNDYIWDGDINSISCQVQYLSSGPKIEFIINGERERYSKLLHRFYFVRELQHEDYKIKFVNKIMKLHKEKYNKQKLEEEKNKDSRIKELESELSKLKK